MSRYDIKGKAVLKTNDKYYLTDHSLQYALQDFRVDNISKILENIVYCELVRRGYNVYIGKFENLEIDFVAEKLNGSKIYVQVCYELVSKGTYEREFGNLKLIKDAYPKYVISLDRFPNRNDEGVIGMGFVEFLTSNI